MSIFVSFYPEISNSYKGNFKGEGCFIGAQTTLRYVSKGRIILPQQNLNKRLKVSEFNSLCMANKNIPL